VETEEQAKLLRLLRCNELQGFLYSKPVPLDRIEAMLASEGGGLAGSGSEPGAPLSGGRRFASPRS
jgi:predicted signal transduction protein with EAL and GGDEF domain